MAISIPRKLCRSMQPQGPPRFSESEPALSKSPGWPECRIMFEKHCPISSSSYVKLPDLSAVTHSLPAVLGTLQGGLHYLMLRRMGLPHSWSFFPHGDATLLASLCSFVPSSPGVEECHWLVLTEKLGVLSFVSAFFLLVANWPPGACILCHPPGAHPFLLGKRCSWVQHCMHLWLAAWACLILAEVMRPI